MPRKKKNTLTAMAPVRLTPIEGSDVVSAAIEIPGAAGGLRDALTVEPREFHKGEKVYVVLDCTMNKLRFDPVVRDEPAGTQTRVHILDVVGATFVDEELVRKHLDDQADRIEEARRAADGELAVDKLTAEHNEGNHADGLVDGCQQCEAEQAATDAEAREAEG